MTIPEPVRDASPLEQADAAVVHGAARSRDHPVVRAIGQASELADQPPMLALSALVLGAGLLLGQARLARTGGRMLATGVISTGLKSAIKRAVDRTRPDLLLDEGRYELKRGRTSDRPANSFPSGHTADAVGIARAIGREYPASRAAGYAAAGLVAAIQIPRCRHYPSDLAAGALVGLAGEWLADRAITRLPGRWRRDPS